jgi:cyclopropane-fatty-acyl-phospholipid synthase
MDIESLKRHPVYGVLTSAVTDSNLKLDLTLEDQSFSIGDGDRVLGITIPKGGEIPTTMSEFALGKAYVEGEFDIEGDFDALFELRNSLAGKSNWLVQLGFLRDLFIRGTRILNKDSIGKHYTFGDEFYLNFIDTNFRFYSHCLFNDEQESLEKAAENKLESMFNGLNLKPGMRLLDIGAGWGGVHEYCGPRGIHVTSLTLTDDSKNYTDNLIQEMSLENSQVMVQDFLEYTPVEPYDAVVIYGVIEHIPYYQKFVKKAWECIKPGGRIYMDASATVEKYDMNDFTRHYIWPGTHTFLCIQEMIQEFLYNGFELVEAVRETKDYELTMMHWADRYDKKKEEIIETYGEELYRAFRIYLYAGCHAFKVNRLQAYHIIAERREVEGARPGLAKRAYHFIRSLV